MTRRHGLGPDDRRSDATEQERLILAGLEDLRDRTAREVMTPRVDVTSLRAPVHYMDVARAFRRSGHSHFPVYEGERDHLLGVLFIKDLFHIDLLPVPGEEPEGRVDGGGEPAVAGGGGSPEGGPPAAPPDASGTGGGLDAPGPPPEGAGEKRAAAGAGGEQAMPAARQMHRLYAVDLDLDLARRVREPFVVPESRNAIELLAEMRRLRRAFAVVVDEYGEVSGVITINDLVSELVGDIHDEYDRSSSPSYKRIDAVRFLVDGAMDVDEVRDQLGIPIPDGEYVTLGGFLFDRFGRIPAEGDENDYRGWRFRVDRMDRRRIAKVVVVSPSATIATGDGPRDAGAADADGK
jgi:CBS domain containing-hemolysin-like protein